MRRIPLPLWLTSSALYLFMYAPIAIVIVYSFNAARFGAGWTGFTLKWYSTLAADRAVLHAAWNTLLLGVLSTVVSTVLGTALGYGLARFRFPGKGLIGRLLYLPVFVPDIILGAALLLFYSLAREWLGLFELGLATMVVAHVTFQVPFVAILVRTRFSGMDPALEEAARDLGATEWQAFRSVTLPLVLPGVLAGAMLAFTLSLDDFVVSFFTSGPGSTTLPILIYSSVKRGITPEINALATLIIIASILGTAAIVALQSRRKWDKRSGD